MVDTTRKFSRQDRKAGDLILSADWNAATKEIQRLEADKVNREGADTLKGPLTIGEINSDPNPMKLGPLLTVANNSTDVFKVNFLEVGAGELELATFETLGWSIQSSQGLLINTTGSEVGRDVFIGPFSGGMKILGGSGNVGIGIGSQDPTAKLHVIGNVIATGTVASHGKLTIGTTPGNTDLLEVKGNAIVTGTVASHGKLTIGTTPGNTDLLEVKGNAIVRGTGNSSIDGNLGIGTISPTAKLHVSGNAIVTGTVASEGKLTIGTTPGNTDLLEVKGNAIVTGKAKAETLNVNGNATAGSLNVTGATSLSAVTASGNLTVNGRGLSKIHNELHVVSNLLLGNDSNTEKTSRFIFHAGQEDFLQITYDKVNSNKSLDWEWGQGISLQRGSGNVGIGITKPTAKLHVNGSAIVTGNATAGSLNVTGATSLGTVTASGNLTVNGTGNSSIAGNLGIGTTSPTVKLHVNGNAIVTGKATAGSLEVTGATSLAAVIASGNLTVNGTGSSKIQGDLHVVNDLAVGKDSTNEKSNRFIFHAGQGNFLQITYDKRKADNTGWEWEWTQGISLLRGSGNVGIGTTKPTEKLEVSGNAIVTGKATAGSLNVTGATSLANVSISGYVGIGTPTPIAQLSLGDLNGSGNAGPSVDNATQLLLGGVYKQGANNGRQGQTTYKLRIEGYDNDGSTVYPIYCRDENNLVDFWIRNRPSETTLPTMYFAGNLGIGTTSPQAKLHVAGTGATKTEVLRVASSVGSNAAFMNVQSGTTLGGGQLEFLFWESGWGINTKTSGKHLYFNRDSDASSNVYIGRANQEMVVRGSDGNVGIGIPSPTEKLHVSGRIKDKTGFLMPVGSILSYAGPNAPDGWLLCNGASLNKRNSPIYQELFDAIGYQYGGSADSFNLPNLQGRVPVGFNRSESDFNLLGKIGGDKVHILTIDQMPRHSHAVKDEGHFHDLPISDSSGQGYLDDAGSGGARQSVSTRKALSGIGINDSGNGQPHNNLQPYITINYIIKY